MKPRLLTRLLAVPALLFVPHHAAADSTLVSGQSFLWSASTGWLDARAGDGSRGAVIEPFICSGFLYSANCGWINLGDSTPANGIRYNNLTGADFGVNHDGPGNLRGLAWSANLGWFNFTDAGAPRVDPLSGSITGFIWSANAGWISLSGPGAPLFTRLAPGRDADADGIPDAWELLHTSSLTTMNSLTDFDRDGSSDATEYLAGTNPADPASLLDIVATQPRDNGTEVTWNSRPTRLYFLLATSDLGVKDRWHPVPERPVFPGPDNLTTALSEHSWKEERRYFKVQPLLPLTP